MLATPPRTLQDLIDRAEITDVMNRYCTSVDTRDWPLFRSVLTDEIWVDMRSWVTRPPVLVSADHWVGVVESMLSGFDATRHYMTNHVHTIDGDEATCVANMAACHYLVEGEVRRMQTGIGYYANKLRRTPDGWRIHYLNLNLIADIGERELHDLARARFAAREGS